MFFKEKPVINTSRTVLLVDDKNFQLISLKDRLEKNYEVLTAQSVKDMLEILDTTELGLMLIDIGTPDIDDDAVIDLLRRESETASIPIIFLCSGKDRNSMLKGKNLGAVDFLLRPFSDNELNDCIEYHFNQEKPESAKPVVLAVGEDEATLKSINWLLNKEYTVLTLPSPDKVKNVLKKTTPDLFLIDCFELIPIIRKFSEHRETPIVCLTSAGTADCIAKAISLGVTDFIAQPIDGTLLKGKVSTQLKHYMILRRKRIYNKDR
jgi:PleD family two-component response regulator